MTIIKKGNKYKKRNWILESKGIIIAMLFGICALGIETWALATIFGLF